MKYSFSAEIDAPNDKHIKISFNSDDGATCETHGKEYKAYYST